MPKLKTERDPVEKRGRKLAEAGWTPECESDLDDGEDYAE